MAGEVWLAETSNMRLAAITGPLPASDGMLFGLGTGLVLLGTFLHWRLAHVAMKVEEDQKDRLLTEGQARRRLTLAKYSGPLTMVLGLAAWCVVLWE